MLPTPILLPQHPYPTAFQAIRLLATFLTWTVQSQCEQTASPGISIANQPPAPTSRVVQKHKTMAGTAEQADLHPELPTSESQLLPKHQALQPAENRNAFQVHSYRFRHISCTLHNSHFPVDDKCYS